jgi:hypothetical protein
MSEDPAEYLPYSRRQIDRRITRIQRRKPVENELATPSFSPRQRRAMYGRAQLDYMRTVAKCHRAEETRIKPTVLQELLDEQEAARVKVATLTRASEALEAAEATLDAILAQAFPDEQEEKEGAA